MQLDKADISISVQRSELLSALSMEVNGQWSMAASSGSMLSGVRQGGFAERKNGVKNGAPIHQKVDQIPDPCPPNIVPPNPNRSSTTDRCISQATVTRHSPPSPLPQTIHPRHSVLGEVVSVGGSAGNNSEITASDKGSRHQR